MFDASGVDAEAVVIRPDLAMWDEAHALGLECVVRSRSRTTSSGRCASSTRRCSCSRSARTPTTIRWPSCSTLLHDVPAGKLAIAELHDATPEDVAELERSGVDAVLVAPGGLAELVQAGPPDV